MLSVIPIRLSNIHKKFGNFVASENVSLDIRPGELLALLGPSGSGKTTLLRVIAGLETQDSGSVFFGEEDMTSIGPKDRRVGFVFQHYALFKHMNILQNVAFGLQVRKKKLGLSNAQIKERVLKLLDLVQLGGIEKRLPSQLSGGQRQRVALARALAVEPKVLLLDEPFGALDAKVRRELRRWLRIFHQQMAITTVFVTHDQDEAMEIADRIVIVNHGRIEQIGTPQEIYKHPASDFVSEFIGTGNGGPPVPLPANLDVVPKIKEYEVEAGR
ncbi:MAG TPA: sulfate ABC transporter ATP-binding protein [Terriglobales bacterium]|jgi:sulfate transport system ATP-binding protein|nr:sulfate ABC transporter ATP-binding protein [Terriglobales bacterium]